jgi:hypothetical protein
MAGTPKISRRSLLQLSAAGAAVLPSARAAAADSTPQLAELIDRHKAATAALDAACAQLDQAEQEVAERYSADACRAWLADRNSAASEWPGVRKAHGIGRLERERQRLDAAERRLALELLACPCPTIAEVRLKARYVADADILLESFARDERLIGALLKSFTA